MNAPAHLSRRLLDIKAAASYLSIGVRTMERLIAQGEVLKVRIGNRTLIDQLDLDAYVDRKKAEA